MPKTNRFRERSSKTVRRTPINSSDGGTQVETVTTSRNRQARRVERRTPIPSGGTQSETISEDTGGGNSGRPLRSYSPTRVGDSASGVGLLEAEFLGALFLLVLILFADTSKPFPDKIMSTMKRGTMLSILFFILALVSGVGPNVARISKAIGGLTVVAILLSSPMTDIIGNLDKFFKTPWVGSTESGPASSSTATAAGTPSTPTGVIGDILHALESQGVKVPTASAQGGLAGIEAYLHNLPSDTAQAAKNALSAILHGGIL